MAALELIILIGVALLAGKVIARRLRLASPLVLLVIGSVWVPRTVSAAALRREQEGEGWPITSIATMDKATIASCGVPEVCLSCELQRCAWVSGRP